MRAGSRSGQTFKSAGRPFVDAATFGFSRMAAMSDRYTVKGKGSKEKSEKARNERKIAGDLKRSLIIETRT